MVAGADISASAWGGITHSLGLFSAEVRAIGLNWPVLGAENQQIVIPDNASPGIGAFVAFAILGVVVVVLSVLMSRQLRRVDERAAIDEAVEAALAQDDAARRDAQAMHITGLQRDEAEASETDSAENLLSERSPEAEPGSDPEQRSS